MSGDPVVSGFDELDRAFAVPAVSVEGSARHFETRSKRISRTGAVLRLNVYAIIAWIKAGIINGWFGAPVLNPELARDADRDRRSGRKTKYEYIQRAVRLTRMRNGQVGGGRLPHRTRGKPPHRGAPARA